MNRVTLVACALAFLVVGLMLYGSRETGVAGGREAGPDPRANGAVDGQGSAGLDAIPAAAGMGESVRKRADASASVHREAVVISEDRVRVSDLDESQQKLMQWINQVLADAGEQTIASEATIVRSDWSRVEAVWKETSDSINAAADQILDFQRPLATEMASKVLSSAQAGLPVPYPVLPSGDLPKNRGPYELFVTSSFNGVTYLLIPPVSSELVRVVDSKQAAEVERIRLLCSTVRPLFR